MMQQHLGTGGGTIYIYIYIWYPQNKKQKTTTQVWSENTGIFYIFLCRHTSYLCCNFQASGSRSLFGHPFRGAAGEGGQPEEEVLRPDGQVGALGAEEAHVSGAEPEEKHQLLGGALPLVLLACHRPNEHTPLGRRDGVWCTPCAPLILGYVQVEYAWPFKLKRRLALRCLWESENSFPLWARVPSCCFEASGPRQSKSELPSAQRCTKWCSRDAAIPRAMALGTALRAHGRQRRRIRQLMGSQCLGQSCCRKIWPWRNSYGSIFGVDEHPHATYFDVHQGHRVLIHSHMTPFHCGCTIMISSSDQKTHVAAAMCLFCWFCCSACFFPAN